MRTQLIPEAITVGILSLISFVVLQKLSIALWPNAQISQYLIIFLAGALIHTSLEFLGLNEKWCKSTF